MELIEAARRVLGQVGPRAVLAELCRACGAFTGVGLAYAGAAAPGGEDLLVRLGRGEPAPSAAAPGARSAVYALQRRVGARGPLALRDRAAEPRIFEALGGADARALLAVPVLRRGGRVGGLLVLVYTEEADLAGADLDALVALARCGATALENAEKLTAARRDQERLFLFARATDEALWDWEIDPDLTWWGGGIQKVLGGSGLEVEPRMAWKLARIHPADAPRVEASLAEARRSRAADWREEYRFRRADDTWAVVEDHGHFLRDEHGRAFRMVGAMQDLTHARRAAGARLLLADASALLGTGRLDRASLLDRFVRLPVPGLAEACAVRLLDPDGADGVVAFGLPGAEPLVRPLLEPLPAEDPGPLEPTRGTVDAEPGVPARPSLLVPLRGGGRLLGLLALLGAPGATFDAADLDVAASLGDRLGVSLENRRLFRALGASRERLEVTLASIADGVVTTDVHGRVDFLNAAAERLTGWTAAEAHGRPLDEVCHRLPRPAAGARPADDPYRSVGPYGSILARRDGTRLLVAESAAPIRERDGATLGEVLVLRDITERHQLEEERGRASKLESLGLLAGGIAHDFNNLLSGILTNVSLVERKLPPGDRLRERLVAAIAATRRASGLTRQLLTFAKGGAPVRASTALPDLLRDTTSFSLQGSSSVAEYDIAPDLHAVYVDAGQISQVVQNLVINASQAMPRGGPVRISAANVTLPDGSPTPLPPGRYVRVAVSDEGPGIARDQLDRLFAPFYTTKETGSGLGLATVYSIVRRHDGHVTVAPDTPGATFVLHLPAAEGPAVPAPAALPGQPLPRARVLAMDDDPDILAAAELVLADAGLEVETARDGASAVRRFREALAAGRPFSVVLLDLTVRGGLGGAETLEHLRHIAPDVRAIVSSGYSEELGAERAHGRFVGVLPKPYTADELVHAVAQALRGAPTGV